ncbi:MAG: dihydrolipoamide acetyltransferase family protein [Burkholderiales bacterium]
MIEFKLPSLGAEMDEGKLVEWKVKPGDRVKKGDVVAVVDTSKAAIDVEIWDEGTVLELTWQPGETLPVGTVIARLLEPGETAAHAEAEKRKAGALVPPPAAGPAPTAAAAPARPAPVRAGARVRVSPAARVRAGDLHVDIAEVAGTGPGGAILLDDVLRAAAARAQPADRGTAMRKAIGAAMARSKREIPHYYLATDIPLARASRWLAAHNESRPVTRRVLLAAMLLKAVALALRKHPQLNGYYEDGAHRPGPGIHVGVAISIRQGGLVAPALHDVDAIGLDDLMSQLTDLVARARAFSLRSSELSDATITVTNLGEQGVDLVQGVIYPPQVALVGFGRVSARPWVENGALVVAPVVTASLSADHRVSDGHAGAAFLDEIARLLQEPERL